MHFVRPLFGTNPTGGERIRVHKLLDPRLALAVCQLEGRVPKSWGHVWLPVLVRTVEGKRLGSYSWLRERSTLGTVVSAFVEAGRLYDLAELAEVRYVESGGEKLCTPEMIASVKSSLFVITDNSPRATCSGSPILAIIDDALPYDDTCLYKDGVPAGRLISAWDQSQTEKPVRGAVPYGVEYERNQLVGCEPSNDAWSLCRYGSHGAQVVRASTAQLPAEGDWDLLFVRTTGETAAIVDALAYLHCKQRRLERPLVVNLSYGNHRGPHDGTSALEEALETFSGLGHLVVVSSGNVEPSLRHSHIRVEKGTDTRLPFSVTKQRQPNSNRSIVGIEVWGDRVPDGALTLESPDGHHYGPVAPKEARTWLSDSRNICLANCTSSPPNDAGEILAIADFDSDDPGVTGEWRLHFTGITAKWDGDAWISDNIGCNASLSARTQRSWSATSPATARAVVAVGAELQVSSEGDAFSKGLTRDGRRKPDLSVLGRVTASTSAAEVSGRIALLLARVPELTTRDAIRVLREEFPSCK